MTVRVLDCTVMEVHEPNLSNYNYILQCLHYFLMLLHAWGLRYSKLRKVSIGL